MSYKKRKHIYLPIALAIYAVVMGLLGFQDYQHEDRLTEFWLIMGFSLFLTIALHFILKRRENNRNKFNNKD